MASTIKIKNGTSGAPSSLAQGELAIDVTKGKLFHGTAGGTAVSSSFTFTQITASDNISLTADTANIIAKRNLTLQIEGTAESQATNFKIVGPAGDMFQIADTEVFTFGSADATLTSKGNMTFMMDADNDETGQSFKLKNYTTDLVELHESDGLHIGVDAVVNITASGTISASGMIQTAGAISSSTGITASNALFSADVTSSGVIKAEHFLSTDDAEITDDLTVGGIVNTDDIRRNTDNSSTTRISMGGNNIQIFAGHSTNEHVQFKNDGTTFNQDGVAAYDFKVEGDTDTHLLFVDSGADKVTIGTDTVSDSLLTVDGDVTLTSITASSDISASSADGILTVPRRHLDQTVQGSVTNSTGSLSQGDIFYAESNVSTVPGKIYAMLGNGNQAPADKDTESYANCLLGVAIGTNSSTDGYLLRGMTKLFANPFPGEGQIGSPAYLGDDGQATGSITGHASDDFIRIIGYGISGSGTVYFDPDKTFIKKS